MKKNPKFKLGQILENTEVCGNCRITDIFKSLTEKGFAYEVYEESSGMLLIYKEDDLE